MSGEAQETIGWVVLRRDRLQAPAALGDQIMLRTWVGKATRLTFERFTEIGGIERPLCQSSDAVVPDQRKPARRPLSGGARQFYLSGFKSGV